MARQNTANSCDRYRNINVSVLSLNLNLAKQQKRNTGKK